MAITIQAVPPAYSSVHGDLVYTVAEVAKTADPVAYPNYKFIADVYINGNLVARIKKVPNPVSRIGIFNIGQTVRSYMSAAFDPVPNMLLAQALGQSGFLLDVQVIFGEEYGFVQYLNQVVDTNRKFYNTYPSRVRGNASLADYLDKVASNAPTVRDTMLASSMNLVPYFPTTTAAISVTVTPFGGGVAQSFSVVPLFALTVQILNLSPVALNAMAAGTVTASTQYYTVAINGQVFRFNLVCEPLYQTYMLHFLNQYGGFEGKLFTKVSRKTIDITRTDFGKLPYTVDSSGVVSYRSANGVYNETRSVYSSQFTEKMVLNSDFLTDAEYRWLGELVVSPMVYLQEGTYFFPVVISDTNYEPRKAINDDLTNLTVNIEFGNQLNAQYR